MSKLSDELHTGQCARCGTRLGTDDWFTANFMAYDGAMLHGSDAYRVYQEWCDDSGIPTYMVWTRKQFYAAMESRGVQRVKTRSGFALVGILPLQRTSA